MKSQDLDILPVYRDKPAARKFYDHISRFYDCVAGSFERKYARVALDRLAIENGEMVLEVGFGTGHCLERIAQSVGEPGEACGLDISPGMLRLTRKRLGKAGWLNRVQLCCGDAAALPYADSTFDAAFMSFTLELFDTPEIPEVLEEVKRVLKPKGRLGLVSLSRSHGEPVILRLYQWAHRRWPQYIDCRPIYVGRLLEDAGYQTQSREPAWLMGLPIDIIVATKVMSGQTPFPGIEG